MLLIRDTFVDWGAGFSDDHVVGVGFLLSVEEVLNIGAFFELHLRQLFHVEDGLVLMKDIFDAEAVKA